ncbi:MAG: sigma-70 family RNA polymerase sigma factor [Acidimicrobiales bacterium]
MPRNSSVTDTRLVRRSQQGDRRAFRALLTRYDWRLRGLAHALLLDPGGVDAVLRLAYVKAWREVVRVDPREDAAAWLYRVVYNACIDGLRREGNRIGAAPSTAADAPDAVDAVSPPVQPMPTGGNGASSATTERRQARVVGALATLAPADRVAVVLVDREGFAPEAAARILGLTPDGVAARLAGARVRITHQLADDAAVAPADEPGPPADEPGPQAQEVESQSERAGSPANDPGPQAEPVESQADEPERQSGEPEAPSEEPAAELDDTTTADTADTTDMADTADTADTKVASRSIAGGSSNGASGGGRTNGSDDGGASGP